MDKEIKRDIDLFFFLERLKNSKEMKFKESMLRNNMNDYTMQILKYLVDKNFAFGISTIKINKALDDRSVKPEHDFNSLLELFKYLEKNNTSSNYDVAVVQNYINKIHGSQVKEIAKEVISKKFKIGVNEKTLEKIFPEDFKSFEVMKGVSYENLVEKLENDPPNIIISQKLDGIRCLAKVESKNRKFKKCQFFKPLGL